MILIINELLMNPLKCNQENYWKTEFGKKNKTEFGKI